MKQLVSFHVDRDKLAIPFVDLEAWKNKHPQSSKDYPDFYVDFNEDGLRYTSSPYEWPAVRMLILERDGRRCRFCGLDGSKSRKLRASFKNFMWYTNGLEVQHIIPSKDGGANHPKNLITLCYSCHKKTFKKGYGGIPQKEKTVQTTLLIE